jgi:hypothetical protein
MKNYSLPLLIGLSINDPMPEIVIQSYYKLPQQAAIERFFTADRLSPDWFTPNTLKINDLSKLQQRIADLKARIEQKYGKYQRVELIEENRYRIIFENADPDMIIAKFRFDWLARIDGIEMQIDNRFMD